MDGSLRLFFSFKVFEIVFAFICWPPLKTILVRTEPQKFEFPLPMANPRCRRPFEASNGIFLSTPVASLSIDDGEFVRLPFNEGMSDYREEATLFFIVVFYEPL